MHTWSRIQVGTWRRRIGGGALVLALAGLLAPTTTSALADDGGGGEIIEIVGEAPPWQPPDWDGHGGPSGDPRGAREVGGGGGGGGGGGSGGGGSGDRLKSRAELLWECKNKTYELQSENHLFCAGLQIRQTCERGLGGTYS